MLVTPVVYEEEPIGLLLIIDISHRFNDDERLIAKQYDMNNRNTECPIVIASFLQENPS